MYVLYILINNTHMYKYILNALVYSFAISTCIYFYTGVLIVSSNLKLTYLTH